MDNSSFAIVPFFQDNALVIIALVLCGLLAALVLVGMVWGAKLKRERVHAEREEAERIDTLEAEGATAPPTEAQQLVGVEAPHVETPGAPETTPGTPHGEAARADAPATDPLANEPIAAAAPLAASPASEAESAPVDTSGGEPVTRLKGLGPKVAARLAELGITTVDQLAGLDDSAAATLDAQLGAFQGRMARDQWREQARLLASGDRAGYEARFGNLG